MPAVPRFIIAMTNVEPDNIADAVAALLCRPDPDRMFLLRSQRLRVLALGHGMAAFLDFMVALCDAQHQALKDLPLGPVPDATAVARAARDGLPAVDAELWSRDPCWIEALHRIAATMADVAMPRAARAALVDLYQMDTRWFEDLANRFLVGGVPPVDRAHTVFITAALQVYFSRIAAVIDVRALHNIPGVVARCPVCGAAPLAGIIMTPGGSRDLHCSLCATVWRSAPDLCSQCGATGGRGHHSAAGQGGRIRAETCDLCRHYLKIIDRSRDDAAEALADDLASLEFDFQLVEAGWHRTAPNPFLLGG
ncbi:MAG: formate dehydrogenase accessory protein FdhE [Azospirillaceae bacterium]|nr:formate dehydrogenase accessory protein FdhE [Azospirillaceae bacterium]